jgi:hypothetical protein
MTLWRFPEETVEDADRCLHRPECAKLGDTTEVDRDEPSGSSDGPRPIRHPAGSSVRYDTAPRECWDCRPAVEMVLGV